MRDCSARNSSWPRSWISSGVMRVVVPARSAQA